MSSPPGQEGDRAGRLHRSSNDKTIGTLIAEAMERSRQGSVITVEESSRPRRSYTWKRHAVRPRHLSPYFATDAERMEVVLEDAIV
jgi:chaperonin GroEL